MRTIIDRIGQIWPEHAGHFRKSFSGRDAPVLDVAEQLSSATLTLPSGDGDRLDALIADYSFLCEEIILAEECLFRRDVNYRLSSFAEANRECYFNAPFMDRYMNGL
ncbi:MAG: hypothetical protein ABW182_12130, partial [Sphingomonas sp.]